MKLLNRLEYYDRVYGSWLGRCIGSALGAPIEFRPYKYIKLRYGEITNYVKPVKTAVYNDDEMYEIVALLALERHGIDLTPEMIGEEWLRELWTMMYTAEIVAYKNMRKGLMPPLSGQKEHNHYFDFIGGQMKADIWGQIAPCSDVAARYAHIDGCVAHDGDGILGEVFVAVLVSLSFLNPDIRENIERAIQFIPAESAYLRFVKLANKLHAEHPNWRDASRELIKHWKKYRKKLAAGSSLKRKMILFSPISGVHVLPNAGIIVLSLLYGQGDFERSICIAAMCALDTDCNCGNVGAIMGAIYGAHKIPNKWKLPLHDTFKTKTRSLEEIKISELAQRVCKIGEKVIEAKCKDLALVGNY